jgi:hypothetical protein
MARRRPPLPELPDTGRRYLENTVRARLASPAVQRFASPKAGRGSRIAIAVLGLAALVAGMVWLSR